MINPVKKWLDAGLPCPYGDWDFKDDEPIRYKFRIFCGHFAMYHWQLLFHPIATVGGWCRSIGTIIRWIPVLWHNQDFDWSYTYRILEFKFSCMAEVFEDPDCPISDAAKVAKELRTAAALCGRIHKDHYEEPAIGPWTTRVRGMWHGDKHKAPYFYDEYMLERDIDYLHTFLTKKVRTWWE